MEWSYKNLPLCAICLLTIQSKDAIINTEINGLVIENIPKGITELTIPVKVIEDARQKDLGKNLINIDYTKEIYLFLNNITYNNINYELKYLQL